MKISNTKDEVVKKIRKIDVVQQKPHNKKLRVAAYCRVSTKYESQKSSIEIQKLYYTKLIENNSDWENAGVFVDYGSRCRMIRIDESGQFKSVFRNP